MHCGFAAAGMGYRPENSDKETTSLETPSVPTSGGLKRPVGLPEVGPQTNDPASRRLDCPVSAPPPPPPPAVCSPESCPAETVNPQAAKPADSLRELPATLESKAPLPSLRSLPEHVASSADVSASLAEDAGERPCHGPRLPPPKLSEKAIVWGSLQNSDDAQYDALDAEPPDGLTGRGTSPNTHSQAEELDIPLLMEHVEEPHMELLKTRTKTERGQDEPDSGEHLCPVALSPLAAPMELSPGDFFSEGRAGTEWERGISPAGKRRPEEVGHEHGGGGIFVEAAKGPSVATDSLLSRPGATQPGAGAECPRVEVGTPTAPPPPPPPPLPVRSLPASDLTDREATAFEATEVVGLVGPPPSRGQLSDQAEDPCTSLASALKELHQLLIVNSRQDLHVSQQEDLPRATSVPQEQATGCEVHREEREPTQLDSPAVPLSFPGYAGVESSVKRQVFEAEAERHRLAVSHKQDMLTVQETSAVESSGFLSLPAFSSQAQAGEHVEEILSQHPSSNHVLSSEASEQSQPPPPPFSLLQSPSQSSFSENMETSESLDTDFQRLMNELLDSSPPLPRDCPQLPISHAEDIDQIVRAGFTPQEATEALERAGGNAELALLILLAKNIVVPT